MICCKEMMSIMDREGIVKKEGYQINDGRILNEVDSEYFFRSEDYSGVAS